MTRALLIAEKPSLMLAVQAVYRQLGTYPIDIEFKSFAGHTMTLLAPGDYKEEWVKWDLSTLPMIPDVFQYKPTPDKLKLYREIKETIEKGRYDFLINCCDPGREGQHIFHNFYQSIGCRLPVKRMWHSDLTEKELERALRQLRDDLTEPALVQMTKASMLRADFDWLIGMNFSRAFTMVSNRNVSLGRVMTPILKIVADRELELANFTPQDYWELEADFGTYKGLYLYQSPEQAGSSSTDGLEEGSKEKPYRFLVVEEGEQILNSIQQQSGVVVRVEKKQEIRYGPKLHSLAELQNEANKTYGYTMAETLEIVQSLYELKILSYPRTDSSFITAAVAAEFPKMLGALETIPSVSTFLPSLLKNKSLLQEKASDKKYVNDKKVSDHYAIVPTGTSFDFKKLSLKQQHIVELVGKRLIAIFLPPIVTNKTAIYTEVKSHLFKTTGSVLEEKGYAVLYGTRFNDQLLPDVKEREMYSVQSAQLLSKQTTPPPRYTDETLNKSLENAGKFVDDEELKEVLKVSKGIGTPATRGGIVEKLVDKKMIERRKKAFFATEYGVSIIQNLGNHPVASPELTGIWEDKLLQIEACTLDPNIYYREMVDYIQKATTEFKSMSLRMQPDAARQVKTLGACPLCQKNVVVGKDYYLCEAYKQSCTFIIGKTVGGAKITESDMKLLLTGKSTKEKTFTYQSGKTGKAQLAFNTEEKRLQYVFPERTQTPSHDIGICPKCSGRVLSGSFYRCEHYSQKTCDFAIGQTILGATLTVEDVQQLLARQLTAPKQMTFKNGKSGTASLYLDDQHQLKFKF